MSISKHIAYTCAKVLYTHDNCHSAVGTEMPCQAKLLLNLTALLSMQVNRSYVDCKKNDKDPRTCLKEGEAVTGCTVEL